MGSLRIAVLACLMLFPASGIPDAQAELREESVLTPARQRDVDASVAQALAWLASKQNADGSFPCIETGQPAVTSLGVLAFLSAGHLPGQGQYGDVIERGVEYILAQQQEDGLFSAVVPEVNFVPHTAAHTAVYNHAISGLALCEAYGMTGRELAPRIRRAIERAAAYTLGMQVQPKQLRQDEGGWRYVRRYTVHDSDLSVTCWQLLFLRSAKNAGFDIPVERIDLASSYVGRCFLENMRSFNYFADDPHPQSRAMAGAGILSMSLSGRHDTANARAAADWVLAHGFGNYRDSLSRYDRYFYPLFFCTQGMFQMGGRYWSTFYPQIVDVLLANQSRQGDWHEDVADDGRYGTAYTTALCVLALRTPNQLLPIFQR